MMMMMMMMMIMMMMITEFCISNVLLQYLLSQLHM